MSLDTEPSRMGASSDEVGQAPVPQATPTGLVTAPVKVRRRPWVFALMAALVAAGALGSAYAFSSINNTREVLAVVHGVSRGERIAAGDIAVVRVSVDPALTPVAASRRDDVVGQRASVDLAAGSLLTRQATTESLVPAEGDSMVGVSLTPAQMPSEELHSGDAVRIVTTPGDQGEVSSKAPVTIAATVAGVREVDETGDTVVDVSVPEADAADLAARAATGRVALVLDSRER